LTTRWATSIRHALTPYLRQPSYAYGGLAVLLLLVFWWDPVVATHRIVKTIQQPEQRGLARPGWSDERGDGAVWNVQLNAIKDRHPILHLSHTLEGESGSQTTGQRLYDACLVGRLST